MASSGGPRAGRLPIAGRAVGVGGAAAERVAPRVQGPSRVRLPGQRCCRPRGKGRWLTSATDKLGGSPPLCTVLRGPQTAPLPW